MKRHFEKRPINSKQNSMHLLKKVEALRKTEMNMKKRTVCQR